MLDQLSGGRLELGVGRGVSPYELRNFGVDPENSRAMFEEALAVLLAGLTRERLNFTGRHSKHRNVPADIPTPDLAVVNCFRCPPPPRRCGIQRIRPPASSTPAATASISSASARP